MLPVAVLDVLGGSVDGSTAEDGFGYIEIRDGVQLSATTRMPDPSLYGEGPYPTVIEYSGYGPSNPAAEEPGVRVAARARLRDRQREPARHRLLGRRVRRLQPRPDGRRLRHRGGRRPPAVGAARPRRHGRAVVLGHHPALHGRHPAAQPRRHPPAVGHPRLLGAGVARRRLQRRVHPRVGAGARPAGRGRRHRLGPGPGRRRRRGVRVPHGPAQPEPRLRGVHPGPRPPPRRCRQPEPAAARGRHRRPRVPHRGVPGRADGPAVHGHGRRLRLGADRAGRACGTGATPTATGPRTSGAGTSSWSSTSPSGCRR